jgi:hypothetical protein
MQAIKVWRWKDAPKKYRALSRHGGDEGWVALVPKGLAAEPVGWMEEGSPFGYCSVSEHALPNGDVVRIGAHA